MRLASRTMEVAAGATVVVHVTVIRLDKAPIDTLPDRRDGAPAPRSGRNLCLLTHNSAPLRGAGRCFTSRLTPSFVSSEDGASPELRKQTAVVFESAYLMTFHQDVLPPFQLAAVCALAHSPFDAAACLQLLKSALLHAVAVW